VPKEPDPFDISDEEIAHNEETLQKTFEYGDLAFRQFVNVVTEIGDYLKEFDRNKPDVEEVREALQEWHQALEKIADMA